DAVGTKAQRQRERRLASPLPTAVPGDDGLRQRLRKEARDLRHAGLEVVDDANDIAVTCPDLAVHAREAAGTALQRCHAHDVVERHPQGEKPRGLAGERVAARRVLLDPSLSGKTAREPLSIPSD